MPGRLMEAIEGRPTTVPAAKARIIGRSTSTSRSPHSLTELAQGKKTGQACRKAGISEYTYYKWKKQYGGLRLDQAKRLRELEKEDVRLKKLVADQALDISTRRVGSPVDSCGFTWTTSCVPTASRFLEKRTKTPVCRFSVKGLALNRVVEVV